MTEIDLLAAAARAARSLAARARREPPVRFALARIAPDGINALATSDPQLVIDLAEMYDEMDADDAAMDEWAVSWKPENLTEQGLI